MLAQNFKTPADLEITDAEFEALVKVLGMLERKEIEPAQFNMETLGQGCGTPMCILGWARTMKGARFHSITDALGDLFLYKCHDAFHEIGGYPVVDAIGPAEAAIALRSYLTTGEPRWSEAMAG